MEAKERERERERGVSKEDPWIFLVLNTVSLTKCVVYQNFVHYSDISKKKKKKNRDRGKSSHQFQNNGSKNLLKKR